jgi:hypothetical protein
VGYGDVTVVINDDPTVLTISSYADAAEQGLMAGQFRLSRSGSSSLAFPLSFAFSLDTSSPSAVSPEDGVFIFADATVGSITNSGNVWFGSIPAGIQAVLINYMPVDDTIVEPLEHVTVSLLPDAAVPPHFTFDTFASASISLLDNDLVPTPPVTSAWILSAESSEEPSNSRSSAALAATICFEDAPGYDVTFEWWTTAGTAEDGYDFIGQSYGYAVVFADTTRATLNIPILFDRLPESDETVVFHARPVQWNPNQVPSTLVEQTATGTIVDSGISGPPDNHISVGLSILDQAFTEGSGSRVRVSLPQDAWDSGFTGFQVLLGTSAPSLPAGYTAADYPEDYTISTNVIEFAPGEFAKYLDLEAVNDGLPENKEAGSLSVEGVVGFYAGSTGTNSVIMDWSYRTVSALRDFTILVTPITVGVNFEMQEVSEAETAQQVNLHLERLGDATRALWVGIKLQQRLDDPQVSTTWNLPGIALFGNRQPGYNPRSYVEPNRYDSLGADAEFTERYSIADVRWYPDGYAVRFPAGVNQLDLAISILPDFKAEGDETLTASVALAPLDPPGGTRIRLGQYGITTGKEQDVLTIHDDGDTEEQELEALINEVRRHIDAWSDSLSHQITDLAIDSSNALNMLLSFFNDARAAGSSAASSVSDYFELAGEGLVNALANSDWRAQAAVKAGSIVISMAGAQLASSGLSTIDKNDMQRRIDIERINSREKAANAKLGLDLRYNNIVTRYRIGNFSASEAIIEPCAANAPSVS